MSAGAPQYIYQAAAASTAPQVTYMAAPAGQQMTYSAAAPVTYSAAAPVTYSAASPVTYSAALPMTYSAAAPATYSAAPATYSAAPVTYVSTLPAAYGAATSPAMETVGGGAVQYTGAMPTVAYGAPANYGVPAGYGALPPAPSMVAYPMAQSYFPTSVQAAWDNHFSALGEKNLDKIMLDYDETSVVRVFDNGTAQKQEFRGTAQIRQFFAGLFAELRDLSTLKAPVIDVDEEPKTVFLVWECPSSGFQAATDTFVFGQDLKIKKQNVVVTKGFAGAAAVSSAAAAMPASSTAVTSAKATSSKKKDAKKKTGKGIC